AIPSALLVSQWIGVALYVVVAVIWLVPDRRFEREVAAKPGRRSGAISAASRLQLFCHGGGKVAILLFKPLRRQDDRKIMTDLFQRHPELFDEIGLFLQR